MKDKRIRVAFILGLLSSIGLTAFAHAEIPASPKKATSVALLGDGSTPKSNLRFFKALPFFSEGHFYLSGTAGASIGHVGNNNPTITYYNNLLTDAYPITHRTSTTGFLGLGGGFESTGHGRIPAVALGLGVYTTPSVYHYNGLVLETAQGGPANLLYQHRFHIQTTRLMAEGKLSWMVSMHDRIFLPYVDGGIGSAWSRASDYTETVATPDGYVPLPGFQSRTTNQFAYQVGGGLGYSFNFASNQSLDKHERLSLGYRFTGLGHQALGIRSAAYPFALNIGSFNTQDVYLTFTHLC